MFVVTMGAACGEPATRVAEEDVPGRPAGAARAVESVVATPRIELCRLSVVLDPVTHRIEATARLTVVVDRGTRVIPIALHPDLWVDSVSVDGAVVESKRAAPPAEKSGGSSGAGWRPAIHEVPLDAGRSQQVEVVMRYGGRLYQDVAAGEKAGEIHNFAMRAHIGPEGIYLSDSGHWHPAVAMDEGGAASGVPRNPPLSHFELTVEPVRDMVLVASGNRVGARLDERRVGPTTWRTPFPLDGLALVGGRHEIHQRDVDGVLVSVHVSASHARLAPALLDSTASYLRLYQPLIGRYPYDEFTVVENFFSSGFAMPGFTVLASQVIAMGEMALRPGYLDHEMLHNWWGNGVLVSQTDGNWCECLTSYCTNYMRHILEGDVQKARDQRRDICYGLSGLVEQDDKPLDSFGRSGGADRYIGYQKGSMVFAMLADRVGQETMWRSLQRLHAERLGRQTGWDDIRAIIEAESGRDLGAYFDSWVRGTGLPDIAIDEARYEERASRLMITVVQRGRAFDVTVPVRLVYDDYVVDRSITIDQAMQLVVVKVLERPKAVELDPDFRILRRIPPGDIMPTVSSIRPPRSLTIVTALDDHEAYGTVADGLAKRYEDSDRSRIRRRGAADLTGDDLASGHVLALGRACLTPAIGRVLIGSPLSFGDGYFMVRGRRYDKPTDAVLCCLSNEKDPGGVICLYYGNGPAALEKAAYATFYGGDSLVVFQQGRPTYREDFERTARTVVQLEPVLGPEAAKALAGQVDPEGQPE